MAFQLHYSSVRAFTLAVFVAVNLYAQPAFQNLAPNGDGTALYFSSSLRLKDTDQYPHPKIFVWEAGRGVRLYAQKPPTISLVFGTALSSSTPYNLLGASVSSDGNTIAIISISDCTWGTPCTTSVARYSAELRRPGAGASTYAGTASLSPNGRFLLVGSPLVYPFQPQQSTLMDLITGRMADIVTWPLPYRHGVSDDGTFIVSRRGGVWLRSGQTSEERPINSELGVSTAKINGPATRVFYPRYSVASVRLALLEVGSDSTRDLAALPSPSTAAPVFDISDDGTIAAYIEAGQAWIVRPADSQRTQIGPLRGVATDLALSGDGTRLFVTTDTSQILRFDLRTMATDEIVPETPYPDIAKVQPLFDDSRELARGGVYDLGASQMPGLAAVRLGGRELHILSAGGDQLRFQVPWDAPQETSRLELDVAIETRSPFQSTFIWPGAYQVRTYAPQWYRTGNQVAALHADFSGPVTSENPARPGEVIHAYGIGFGPVVPQPETGNAAGSNPLSVSAEPVVCQINQNSESRSADVLFAGLAPRWIGLYQIDVRLPETLSSSEAYLNCRVADQITSGLLPIFQ